MFDVAYLISEETAVDNIGNEIKKQSENEVFIDVASVSQNEFYKSAQSGLRPEYKFTLFSADYGGQEKIRYNDAVYYIYRTYEKDEKTELYVTKKAVI